MTDAPSPPATPPLAEASRSRWGPTLDWGLGLALVAFLAYRFIGLGPSAPGGEAGVPLLPPGTQPAFIELSSTR
jgi:hypothetical protein